MGVGPWFPWGAGGAGGASSVRLAPSAGIGHPFAAGRQGNRVNWRSPIASNWVAGVIVRRGKGFSVRGSTEFFTTEAQRRRETAGTLADIAGLDGIFSAPLRLCGEKMGHLQQIRPARATRFPVVGTPGIAAPAYRRFTRLPCRRSRHLAEMCRSVAFGAHDQRWRLLQFVRRPLPSAVTKATCPRTIVATARHVAGSTTTRSPASRLRWYRDRSVLRPAAGFSEISAHARARSITPRFARTNAARIIAG